MVFVPDTPEVEDATLTQLLLKSAPPSVPDPPASLDPLSAQINLHALLDHLMPETLRMMGQIAKKPIVVLVDGGSTNNFIQDQLGLPMQLAQSSQVLEGNGE